MATNAEKVLPKFLIFGDATARAGLKKVTTKLKIILILSYVQELLKQGMAESIVKGTAYHHFCNRFTNLTDEIYKIQDEYHHVVISCLSNILYAMVTTNDIDSSLRVCMR